MKVQSVLLIMIVLLIIVAGLLHNSNKNLREEISIAEANNKALLMDNSLTDSTNRILKLTINQLNYYNDSILNKLNETRRSLGIKDKNIQELQYLLSVSKVKETIVVKDTIFKDPDIKVDTLVGNEWYKISLNLCYPSTISVEPSFVNEYMLFTTMKKETIKPPKKTWIGRLFQRKHYVMEAVVTDKNPYSEVKQQKFIKVLQ